MKVLLPTSFLAVELVNGDIVYVTKLRSDLNDFWYVTGIDFEGNQFRALKSEIRILSYSGKPVFMRHLDNEFKPLYSEMRVYGKYLSCYELHDYFLPWSEKRIRKLS